MVRARGFVSSGIDNGTGWFVQAFYPSVARGKFLRRRRVELQRGAFGFNVEAWRAR